jgi:hypothetical protein
MPRVRLRKDLGGFFVPAYDSIEAPDNGIGTTMLCAEELDGAEQLPDLCEDTEPEYCFNRIKLKDRRIFFMHGIDLDWI